VLKVVFGGWVTWKALSLFGSSANASGEDAEESAPPEERGSGGSPRLLYPIDQKYKIGADFDQPRGGGIHEAVDIGAPTGEPVYAAASGRVAYTTSSGSCGIGVSIRHDYDADEYEIETISCHLSEVHVVKGQKVARGEKIGLVGNTGNSSAPHLHFALRIGGVAVDPKPYFVSRPLTRAGI